MTEFLVAVLLLALVLFAGRYVFRRFNHNVSLIWLFVLALVLVLGSLILFPALWLH